MTHGSKFAIWLDAFIAEEQLPGDFATTVDSVWRPLSREITDAARGRGAFLVGVCGPQASGKSTSVAVLKRLLEDNGNSVAALSIDDLYLPRRDRQALARRVHPLLSTRGPPGTHDVAMGQRLFHALAQSGDVALPRFDKAADDRRPPSAWDHVTAPVDIILFEGWCVGARPESDTALAKPLNDLERDHDPDGVWRRYVNAQLEGPYRALFESICRLVFIRAPGFETILSWRREQERKLRARLSRKGVGPTRTMSDDEVATFVAHYERLTRHILTEMPARADDVINLDAQRRPLPT